MVQRVVTSTQTKVVAAVGGYALYLTVRYVESTISGGRSLDHTEVYDRLTREELSDILEHIAHGPMAGDEYLGSGLQLSLI